MRIYVLSAGAGVLVGVLYGLPNVRSPAPHMLGELPTRPAARTPARREAEPS